MITRVAGTYGPAGGHAGDGGPATEAQLDGPGDVGVIPGGFLFNDVVNNVVRKVEARQGGPQSMRAGRRPCFACADERRLARVVQAQVHPPPSAACRPVSGCVSNRLLVSRQATVEPKPAKEEGDQRDRGLTAHFSRRGSGPADPALVACTASPRVARFLVATGARLACLNLTRASAKVNREER